MPVQNGIISSPISLRDVQTALGEKFTELSTACTSSKINMFAKYKPVRYPSVVPLNGDERQGIHKDWGLILPKSTSVTDIIKEINGHSNGWTYERPTGGSASPYRLSDFEGYNHNAKFEPTLSAPTVVENGIQGKTMRVSFSMQLFSTSPDQIEHPENSDIIQLSDLSIADYYFGVYLKQVGGSQYVQVIGPDTIRSGMAVVSVRVSTMPAGDWTIYPIVASEQLTQDGLDTQKTYSTIYGLPTHRVELVKSLVSIIGAAEKKIGTSASYVEWSITVRNDSTDTKTFNNNQVEIRYGTSEWSDPMMSPETYVRLENGITVEPGASKVIGSGRFGPYDSTSSFFRSCKIIVSLNAGTYRDEFLPMEPIIVTPPEIIE